ncbi:hypothetical protein ACEWY4_019404 [Coilia grayii]|uniref:Gastrin/cholecystokinin peptide hormone domain-containing protein n=1 Tax=Coilia grayii TaxID=363190 RepID=A0ABD1JCU0_9TELE
MLDDVSSPPSLLSSSVLSSALGSGLPGHPNGPGPRDCRILEACQSTHDGNNSAVEKGQCLPDSGTPACIKSSLRSSLAVTSPELAVAGSAASDRPLIPPGEGVSQDSLLLSALLLCAPHRLKMNCGICVCVLLAALSSSGCLGLPAHPPHEEGHARAGLPRAEAFAHRRHSRSAPAPSGALLPFTKAALEDEQQDTRTSLNQLIATLIARKGASRRNSVLTSRASGPTASHRIKDRDYMGWMDFGRRSAEEYEYSS